MHTRPMIVRMVASLFALGVQTTASALEVPVGRVTALLVDEEWQQMTLEDKGEDYTGEVAGTIQSETRILMRGETSGRLQAVLVVRASSGGMGDGYMAYSPKCESSDNWYAKGNKGFSLPYAECLQVGRRWPAREVLRVLAPKALASIDARMPAALPQAWTPVIAWYSNSNGSFVDLRMFVVPEYQAQDGAKLPEAPPSIDPQVLALAEALMDGARSSVRSISGKLPIPPLRFGPPPTPRTRTAQAAPQVAATALSIP